MTSITAALSRRASLQVLLGVAAAPVFGQQGPGEAFSMTVSGKPWAATRSAAFRTLIAGVPGWNINGFLDGPKISHVGFLIYPASETTPAGIYPLGKSGGPKAHDHGGSFNVDMMGGNILDDNFHFTDGEVSVTAYDAARKVIAGTFSGIGKNSSGATLDITNGRFTDVGLTAR